MNAGYALIACDVFADELSGLFVDPPWRDLVFLQMGLHDYPDKLRTSVQAIVDTLDADGRFDHIALAYGMCGNGLVGVQARSKSLVIPKAHDCISILLGSAERHEAILKANPATYFYSPGWIRNRRVPGPDREHWLKSFYTERYPDDPDLVDDLIAADVSVFSHHNCAAYVDLTNDLRARCYCENCAGFMGWQMTQHTGDASWLQALVRGPWSSDKFQIVAPGESIVAACSQLSMQ